MKDPKIRAALLRKYAKGEVYGDILDQLFKDFGFYPRLKCVFEEPRFAAVMGGQSVFDRVPGDMLHIVRPCVRLAVHALHDFVS